MNIDAIIQQLSAFRQEYGDLPVYQLINGLYTPLVQAPWLASPVGAVPGPGNYVVVFGASPYPVPPVPII